jgi:hypothetical protein
MGRALDACYSSSTRRGSFLCFARRSSRRVLSSNFFVGKIGARGRGRNLSFSIVILFVFFFGTESHYTSPKQDYAYWVVS